MRILVAPQEFKGSLTALAAATAVEAGIRSVLPDADVDLAPMADGGPGTVEALIRAASGRFSYTDVDGPLGEPVKARWGRIDDGRTAVIEMAAASGLVLVPRERLDPRRASTYGVGQLLTAALDAGVERILIGVGGSATNDGGAGAAVALGARLLDDGGDQLPPGGAALAGLATVDVGGLDARLRDVEIVVLSDVENPLLGAEGASAIYGPQKGADAAMVAQLDRALANYAAVVERDLGVNLLDLRGGGAAGGLAAGLVAFAGARIASGFRAIAEAADLAERIAAADVVISGEGKIDRQSSYGKTLDGVRALTRAAERPLLAVCGQLDATATLEGILDVEAAGAGVASEDEAMQRAAELLEAASVRLVRRFLDRPDGG